MSDKPVKSIQQLRQVAEARVAQSQSLESAAVDKHLLHELRVHQIELEMQNEELRHAHIALEESRDKYVNLYDFSPTAYLTLTQDGLISEANLTIATLLKVDRKSLLKRRFSQFVVAENTDRWYRHFVHSFKHGEKDSCELSLQLSDKSVMLMQLNCLMVVNRLGKTVMHIALTDITESRLIEDALRSSEYRWKFAIEGSGDGLWDWNIATSTVFFSKNWKTILGYSEDEIGNDLDEWTKRVHPEDLAKTLAALQDHFDGKTLAYITEYRILCKDGIYKWIRDRGLVVDRTQDNKPVRMVGTHTDVTASRIADESLRIAATAFEAQEAMMVSDAQQKILKVNQAFTTLTGYKEEDAVGQSVSMLKSGMHDADFYQSMWESIQGVGYWHGEIWDRHKNGEIFLARMLISAVKDGEDKVTHYVASFIDITLDKQAEEALIEAKASAEKANKNKSRFLAAASHDLRQPLTALSLYVDVLIKKDLSNEIGLVAKIQDCVSSLSELLNDLLDVSKLDAGVVTPRLSDVPINDILQSILTIHSPEAELKGLRIRTRPSSELVRIDPQLMQRILSNLVFNAIRYTNKGGILIGCRRHQGKLWIEVWDTGIGFPEDKIDRIFEEFTQLGDDARNRGSGLGLAIVNKSANLLGLKIRVRSRLGQGSMFAIEVPLGHSIAAKASPTIKPSPVRLTIALVDDNVSVLEAFSLAIKTFGHEVISATSGRELFNLLGNRIPDILISDYRLADGEIGLDLIATARRLFMCNLPAILVTGDTDPELLRKMAKQDVTICHKPLRISALDMMIRKLVSQNLSPLSAPSALLEKNTL